MGPDSLSVLVFVWGGVDEERLRKMQPPRLQYLQTAQKCFSWPRRSYVLLWGLCFPRMAKTDTTTFFCFLKLMLRREAINAKTPQERAAPRERARQHWADPGPGGLCLVALSGLPGSDPHKADYRRIKLTFKRT